MNDSDAESLWAFISKMYSSPWDNVAEEAPDEADLQMLKAIEKDPECHKFSREQDINWDLSAGT